MILVTVLIGVTLPLWLVAAAALSPVLPGRWRPLRLLWVVILYLVCESVLLVVLFGLWVWVAGSGGGSARRTSRASTTTWCRACCGCSSARRGGCST